MNSQACVVLGGFSALLLFVPYISAQDYSDFAYCYSVGGERGLTYSVAYINLHLNGSVMLVAGNFSRFSHRTHSNWGSTFLDTDWGNHSPCSYLQHKRTFILTLALGMGILHSIVSPLMHNPLDIKNCEHCILHCDACGCVVCLCIWLGVRAEVDLCNTVIIMMVLW